MNKKQESHNYLIGFRKKSELPSLQVTLAPLGANNEEPKISYLIGDDKESKGNTLSAKKILEFRPHIFHDEIVNGELKMMGMEQEPSGYFERLCGQAGCGWFLPFVERMAAGEIVPIEEIQMEYRKNNSGEEMISQSWGAAFRL